jgi:hypothetical protein
VDPGHADAFMAIASQHGLHLSSLGVIEPRAPHTIRVV